MIFLLKQCYFNALKSPIFQNDFIDNINRTFYVVKNLSYKGKIIDIAIPLRSNISPAFQKTKKGYIETASTPATRKGNIAGWHINKAIPINDTLIISNDTKRVDILNAKKIADSSILDIIKNAQSLLSLLERGKYVYGAINFDCALQEMDKLIQQQQLISKQELVVSTTQAILKDTSQTQQEMNTKPLEVDEKTQAVADCLAETLTNPKKKKLLIKNGKLRLAPLSKALSLKSYDLDKSILTEFEKLKNPIEGGATEELSKLLIKYIKRSDHICKLAKPFSPDKGKFHEPQPDEQNN